MVRAEQETMAEFEQLSAISGPVLYLLELCMPNYSIDSVYSYSNTLFLCTVVYNLD